MKNIASNEDIRHRWNGHHRNHKMAKTYRRQAGCCGRIGHILCGDIDEVYGPSKLPIYSRMVELSWEIKELEDGNAQRMKDKDEKFALPTDIDAI